MQIEGEGESGSQLARLLPVVDNEAELSQLEMAVGQTGNFELQRSSFYRIKPHVDFVRDYLSTSQDISALEVLNIGPGNMQEASVLAVLAHNSGILGRMRVDFVDLATREMIRPEMNLGVNIWQQAIEPPQKDREAYVFADGEWRVGPEVQSFIYGSLDQTSNFFGVAIENFCRNTPINHYDIVTFNNIAQYLGQGETRYDNPIYQTEGNFLAFQAVILSVAERVKPGGVLLSQVTGGINKSEVNTFALDRYIHSGTNFDAVFDTLHQKAGIYRRISEDPLQL